MRSKSPKAENPMAPISVLSKTFIGDSKKSNKSEGTRKGLSHMANSDPEINNKR